MNKKRLVIPDVILFALCAVYFIGTMTFLKPCATHDDGSWMTCHWAGQALVGLSCALAVLSALKLAFSSAQVRLGIAIATIPSAVLAVFIPGQLISLCMMNSMRCHSVMRPGATVFGVLIAAISLIDALMLARAAKR